MTNAAPTVCEHTCSLPWHLFSRVYCATSCRCPVCVEHASSIRRVHARNLCSQRGKHMSVFSHPNIHRLPTALALDQSLVTCNSIPGYTVSERQQLNSLAGNSDRVPTWLDCRGGIHVIFNTTQSTLGICTPIHMWPWRKAWHLHPNYAGRAGQNL